MFLPGALKTAGPKIPWGALTNSQLVQQRYHIDHTSVVYTNNEDVTIYKAQFKKSMTTGEMDNIYVKAIQRSKAGERAIFVEKQLEVVKAIKHPYVVKVLDTFLFPRWAFIFMEALKGSLADELAPGQVPPTRSSSGEKQSPTKVPSETVKSPSKASIGKVGVIPEEQAKVWFGEIADALRYLHYTGWAHRDINPGAILIEDHKRAALCSFGWVINNSAGKLIESHVPTHIAFMSPERISGHPYNPFAADVYSLGMVMFVATSGIKLFESAELDHVKSVQLKLPKLVNKSYLSKDLKDLIKKMCDVNQAKRPLMRKLIKHPWFTTAGHGVKSVSPLAQWPNKDRGYQIKRVLGNDWKHNETFPAKIEAAGYRIEEKIGQGGFGSVYRGWKGNRPIAIKVIDVINQSEDYKKKYKDRELEVLRHYDHENICKIYDIYVEKNRFTEKETKINKEVNQKIFIFMELAKGDMEHLEKQQKPEKRFQEVHARPLLLGAAKGVEYLHGKRVCHRDLKLANILYKSKRHAVITDFSFAKETPRTVMAKSWVGTLLYQSPEILAADDNKGYDPYAADVWAFGCCIFVAITGSLPFNVINKEQLVRKQKESLIDTIRKAKVSDEARDLLFKTMKYDEKDRIPFANIVKHNWFWCEKFTYATWPDKNFPDPNAPVPPLLGV